jgi:hypothetical protein
MGAFARCFPIDGRLRHFRKVGRRHWCHEAETGSLMLGLASSQMTSATGHARVHMPARTRLVSRAWSPVHAEPPLHAERAIHMADTSQSARVARVDLAQPKNTKRSLTYAAVVGHLVIAFASASSIRPASARCHIPMNSFAAFTASARRPAFSAARAAPIKDWARRGVRVSAF